MVAHVREKGVADYVTQVDITVQEFLKDFKTANSEYSQYQKAITQWKQETGKEPEMQPCGVRAKLAANRKKIEQEQKNAQRTRSKNKERGAR